LENLGIMIEIERKFLVKSDKFKKDANRVMSISQGFLNTDKERTVRVRVSNGKGYITVKGISSKDGTSRFEWEKKIKGKDARTLLTLCEGFIIKKNRYEVEVEGHLFEIDEFVNENEGLVVAEIELQSKDEIFTKPDWLGMEVTGDIKFYNSYLSKEPYTTW